MRLRSASGNAIPHWGSRQARQQNLFVSPWLKDLSPVVWDRYGVGGEEELDEEEAVGEDPERLRLQEDAE
eukprot:907601-Karenia_brevis.AAC.1